MFTSSTDANFVAERPAAQERLILQCMGPRDDFDIIIVGSGVGGGVLADDLAERAGHYKRLLLLEAGSFLYPTHVYNSCRFPNYKLAKHYGCDVFWQEAPPPVEHAPVAFKLGQRARQPRPHGPSDLE